MKEKLFDTPVLIAESEDKRLRLYQVGTSDRFGEDDKLVMETTDEVIPMIMFPAECYPTLSQFLKFSLVDWQAII